MTESYGNYNRKKKMSDYKWCHAPKCHQDKTLDRIRGSKGSKVLRTRKIKQQTDSSWYRPNDFMNYFCSQGCMLQYVSTHIERIVAIAPRHEPLETPINDPVKTDGYYGWRITERGIDTTE